jgi:hypothetical protein
VSSRVRATAWIALILWTAAVCWRYGAILAAGLTLSDLFRRIGVVAAGGIITVLPALGLWYVGARWGRPASRVALAALVGAASAVLAAASGVLGPFILLIATCAAAYGYGAGVARWLDLDDQRGIWVGAPLLAAIGWAALITIVQIVGVARILITPVIAAIVATGLGLAVIWGRRLPWVSRLEADESAPPIFAWWGLAVVLLIGLIGGLAPEIRSDALAAHLPIARTFAQAGGLVEMRDNRASYLQINAELLYAAAMTLHPGAALAKLYHYAAGLLASLVVYATGARAWNPRAGLAAAVLVAGTPLVWWLGSTAYTDLWLVLFVAALAQVLILFGARPTRGRALAAGLVAGAAVGTKLPSLAAVAPLVAVLLVCVALRSPGPRRWHAAGALVLGMILTGACSFARAWLLTGNPVFPLLNAVFQSPYARSVALLGRAYRHLGMGRSVTDFLLIPWRVTYLPERFVEDGTIGPAYLALLPAAAVAVILLRHARWLAAVITSAVAIWFLTSMYLRFLVPVLPLVALVSAAGLLATPRHRTASAAAVLCLALAVATAAAAWVASGPWYFPVGIVRRSTTRDAFLAASDPGYPVARFAAASLPAGARLYSAGHDLTFYYDRAVVTLTWHGTIAAPRLRRRALNALTGRELQQLLLAAGFTHLVVNRSNRVVTEFRRPGGWLARETFWDEGPRLEFACREHYLFTLDRAARARTPGRQEFMRNPDRSVQLRPGAHVQQVVAVRPGGLYALEVDGRARDENGRVGLSIQWLDTVNQAADYSAWREAAVGTARQPLTTACSAPAGAVRALVRVSAVTGDLELFRISLRELQ